MDMSLREWLALAGMVILALVLIDGYRRVRRAKKDSLEMSLGMGGEIENSPIDEHFNPELPNGGARIISDKDPLPRIEPIEGANSIDHEERGDIDILGVDQQDHQNYSEFETPLTANNDSDDSLMSEVLTTDQADSKKSNKAIVSKLPDSQEVIIINVLCQNPGGFKFTELKNLFDACGMIYGERSIFHRHEETSQNSPIQFSVANAVEPGYFPVEQQADLYTPGISFFLTLPGPKDSMKAFDYMLETARCLVSNLSGELKDERRSDMTKQTIEHCRQRIKDFERRKLSLRL